MRKSRVSALDLCFSPFRYSRAPEAAGPLLAALRASEENAANFFAEMPYETIIGIFSYLKSSRDLCSVACVSKCWKIVSAEPTLWKPLYLLRFGPAGSSVYDPTCSWKINFLKRKQELHVEQIAEGRPSYAKKKRENPGK